MKTIKPAIIALASALMLSACADKAKEESAANATPKQEAAQSQAPALISADAIKESAKAAAKEAIKELPYAAEVQKAMAKLRELPVSEGEFSPGSLTGEKAESILKSLREIPVENTPEDFQAAYRELVNSYGEICDLAKKLPSKETLSDKKALTGAIVSALASENSADKLSNLKSEIENSFKDLDNSRKKLAEIAAKYVK